MPGIVRRLQLNSAPENIWSYESAGPLRSGPRHLTAGSKIGGAVKKTFIVARNIVGVAGLLLAGYVLVTSIPDLGRYIKISTM